MDGIVIAVVGIPVFIVILLILWLLFFKFDILRMGEKCTICKYKERKVTKVLTQKGNVYKLCDDCFNIATVLVTDCVDLVDELENIITTEKEIKNDKEKKIIKKNIKKKIEADKDGE